MIVKNWMVFFIVNQVHSVENDWSLMYRIFTNVKIGQYSKVSPDQQSRPSFPTYLVKPCRRTK